MRNCTHSKNYFICAKKNKQFSTILIQFFQFNQYGDFITNLNENPEKYLDIVPISATLAPITRFKNDYEVELNSEQGIRKYF